MSSNGRITRVAARLSQGVGWLVDAQFAFVTVIAVGLFAGSICIVCGIALAAEQTHGAIFAVVGSLILLASGSALVGALRRESRRRRASAARAELGVLPRHRGGSPDARD